ncbi:MAG: HD domain-containing protein [bacterium]
MINQIEAIAKEMMQGASGCHGWLHVNSVRLLALKIAKAENANLFVVEVAALLHDIGRKAEMDSKGQGCHAELGSEQAEKILAGFPISDADKQNIIGCIKTHRYRKNLAPQSLEAKIIFDADKLDSIGAIGLARAFYFAGKVGAEIYTGREELLAQEKDHDKYSYTVEDTGILEYEVKLKFVAARMLTDTGRILANHRHEYMSDFIREFKEEINCNE